MWIGETAHATIRLAETEPWRYMTMLAAPPALLLVAGKLIKYTVTVSAGSTEHAAVDSSAALVLSQYGLLPGLLLAGSLVFGLYLQLRYAHVGRIMLPAAIAFCLAGALIIGRLFIEPPAWIALSFVEVIRNDLLFCVGFALTGVLAMGVTRLLRPLVLAFLHLAAAAAGVLAIVDTGYFLKTGSLADSYLLAYALSNSGDIRYVLGGELASLKSVIIVVPAMLALLPVAVANRRGQSRVDLHRATPGWSMKRGWLLAGLTTLVLLFTPGIAVEPAASALRTSTPGMLLQATTFDADAFELEEMALRDDYHWSRSDSTRRWNVVVVILESVRAEPLGYGRDEADRVMPFLDSLSRAGLRVEDMSAIVPHTNKALVSILCGIPPHLSQGRSEIRVPTCLPRLLDEHGYATAFFTPAKLEFERKDVLLDQMGFRERYGDGSWDGEGFTRVNYFGHEDLIILEPALDWMSEQRDVGRPYVASLLTLSSHHDYGLPGIKERSWVADDAYNRYLNTLRYQDDFLRRMLRVMRERGELDDTIVVIVGDHGEAFAEHGLRFHSGVVYGEVLHVPAVILAPEGADSLTAGGVRLQTDILPTIADLLRVDQVGGKLPGATLRAPAPDRTTYAASWLENQSMSLRREERKYVYHFRRKPIEVFDLSSDPGELSDLSTTVAPSVLTNVERELLGWRASINAFHEGFGTVVSTMGR